MSASQRAPRRLAWCVAAAADPCPGRVTQFDLDVCADRRAARAEPAVQRAYTARVARVDSTRRAALADAQTSWERYPEAYRRSRASAAEGGSMQPMRRDEREESR